MSHLPCLPSCMFVGGWGVVNNMSNHQEQLIAFWKIKCYPSDFDSEPMAGGKTGNTRKCEHAEWRWQSLTRPQSHLWLCRGTPFLSYFWNASYFSSRTSVIWPNQKTACLHFTGARTHDTWLNLHSGLVTAARHRGLRRRFRRLWSEVKIAFIISQKEIM